MKGFTVGRLLGGVATLALTGTLLLGNAGGATAQSAVPAPPAAPGVSKQLKAPIPADSAAHKAKSLKAKGKTSARTSLSAAADASVYFGTALKYCSNFVYLPVVNTSAVTKYYQVQVYTATDTRNFYGSVSANLTSYPYFHGLTGNYTAYLYVWDGSSYSYDSYASGNVNCSVSVTWTKTGSYLLATVKNNGNTYASVKVQELAPYGAFGTYTGAHWFYPAPGGGTAYQYLLVGGAGTRYGVIAENSGSTYDAWWAYGIW